MIQPINCEQKHKTLRFFYIEQEKITNFFVFLLFKVRISGTDKRNKL